MFLHCAHADVQPIPDLLAAEAVDNQAQNLTLPIGNPIVRHPFSFPRVEAAKRNSIALNLWFHNQQSFTAPACAMGEGPLPDLVFGNTELRCQRNFRSLPRRIGGELYSTPRCWGRANHRHNGVSSSAEIKFQSS